MKTTYVLHDFNTCGIFQIHNCYVTGRRLCRLSCLALSQQHCSCVWVPETIHPPTCRVGIPWCKPRRFHQALRVVLNWVFAVEMEVIIIINYFFHFFTVLKLVHYGYLKLYIYIYIYIYIYTHTHIYIYVGYHIYRFHFCVVSNISQATCIHTHAHTHTHTHTHTQMGNDWDPLFYEKIFHIKNMPR